MHDDVHQGGEREGGSSVRCERGCDARRGTVYCYINTQVLTCKVDGECRVSVPRSGDPVGREGEGYLEDLHLHLQRERGKR